MKFQRQARLPLGVGHLEQVDLRHGAGDVEQRVDPAERGQRLIDNGLAAAGSARSMSMTSASAPAAFTAFAVSSRLRAVPRHEDERGEVAREADGRRPADALARAGDDRD